MPKATRAAQLRAAAARSRDRKRQAGLEAHQVWLLPSEWRERVKPLIEELEAARMALKTNIIGTEA